MVWGTIIAAYLFLAGVAGGAFLTSSYVSRKYPDVKSIRIVGRIISPILLAIGLFMLMFDAEAGFKHPLRFIYLYTNFNSVMTLGTYILTVFILVGLYVALMEVLKKDVNKIIEYVGIVFAVLTAIYTGFLIGVVATVPLWNTSILPVLFVVSALSTGIAATLVFASFVNKEEVHKIISVKIIHLSLLGIEIFLLFTMLYIMASANQAAASSVASLITGEYSMVFWIGLIMVGLVVPIIVESLELWNMRKQEKLKAGMQAAVAGSSGIAVTVTTETFVLIGGFILRYLILAAAVPLSFL